jgi:hypothetical protein
VGALRVELDAGGAPEPGAREDELPAGGRLGAEVVAVPLEHEVSGIVLELRAAPAPLQGHEAEVEPAGVGAGRPGQGPQRARQMLDELARLAGTLRRNVWLYGLGTAVAATVAAVAWCLSWVLGPVGGTQNYPPAFLWRAGWRNGLAEALRTVANGLQLRVGRFRRAAARADALLAATTTAARDLHAVAIEHHVGNLECGLQRLAEIGQGAVFGQQAAQLEELLLAELQRGLRRAQGQAHLAMSAQLATEHI